MLNENREIHWESKPSNVLGFSTEYGQYVTFLHSLFCFLFTTDSQSSSSAGSPRSLLEAPTTPRTYSNELIEGYLHRVKDVTSPKGSSMINYFSAQLQTKDTRIRLVSFDTKKHSKLASMAATRQPVSITQYKKQKNRINSIEEIVLENKTNINIIPRKLDFEFEEEPSTEIQHIVQDCPPHSLVSFVGVVSELSIEMETTTQLIFKEAIVRDGSAAIRVVFGGHQPTTLLRATLIVLLTSE